MKQQINLFQPMFRKQKKVFTAVTMLQIALFFMVVFGGLYAYELSQLRPFKQQISRLDNDLRGMQTQLDKFKTRQPAEAKGKLLQKEIARVTKELEDNRRLQQILGNKEFGNDKGFSGYLEALARQRVEGAWLTHISITGGGVALGLEGITLSSELVPVYIQRLANEETLSGASFNVMELKRSEEIEKAPQIVFKFRTN